MIKLILFIVLVLVVIRGFWSLEARTLYYPDRTLIANPGAIQLPFEAIEVKTADGFKIHGWFIPVNPSMGGQARGPAPTILFSHGNAGNISHRLEKAMMLHQAGANLLFYDYRGYGQSEGTPSEKGTYQDAEAMVRFLVDTKGIKPEHLYFMGESLGCAVATEMATRHAAAGLILESPFTSTVAMGKLVFPWLLVKWMVRYHYDNQAKIPTIRMPTLIMHSPQDDVIPFAMGQALFAAAPGPKTFFELQGDHNGGFLETGERYVQAIRQFIQR